MTQAVVVTNTTYPLIAPTIQQITQPIYMSNHVTVQMIYSPINPADINMLEGRYIVKPELPFVPGNEGVGKIIAVGENVKPSLINQRVIFPFQGKSNWLGFWRETLHISLNDCIIVPDFIDDQQACMLSINPLTAYKLLTSFSTLNKGDWIIQNAANSAVGRWVIYLANQLQLNTVNIVRREALVDDLKTLGAQEVIVEHDRFSQSISQKGRCKLALNGVGGASAKEIAKCLDYKGYLVTYGAMAKEPLTFGNALFIFNTISASGFNRTHWIQEIERSAVQTIYNQLFDWLNDTPFQIPIHQCFDLTSIDEALQVAQQPSLNGKVLLRLGNL